MTRTIWLASYPKSGNTWLRALIGNLSTEDGGLVGIKALVRGNAGDRNRFDCVALIDSGLLTHDEIDCLRPHVYEAIARAGHDDDFAREIGGNSCRFVKVHDAYTMSPTGEPLLGGSRGAHGAIVIVRDPRDVAPSLANHQGLSIDHVIDLINDENTARCERRRGQNIQLRQKLRDWSGHVASWLNQTDIPVHLIRYEDLHDDTAGALSRALGFAGLAATEERINRAVAFCDFARLRQQEDQNGFAEAPRPKVKFFRRGEVGSWRAELSREQVVRIESCHQQMMLRLGYEPSYTSKLARAG